MITAKQARDKLNTIHLKEMNSIEMLIDKSAEAGKSYCTTFISEESFEYIRIILSSLGYNLSNINFVPSCQREPTAGFSVTISW